MQTGVPQADGTIRAEPAMDASEVAGSVLHMAALPLSTNVQFMTVMATQDALYRARLIGPAVSSWKNTHLRPRARGAASGGPASV